MAPARHREKRLSLSVPGRSEENLGLKITNRSRDTRRQSSSSSPSSSSSLVTKQKTRTISVPAGLKEILNDLSKEVEDLPSP